MTNKAILEKERKTIKVDYLARVEGEGGMFIRFKDNQVVDVKLKIFEPPRFFEGFLRGRRYSEAPDITARICGICPVAYQMSSVHAMESIFGVELSSELRELRRLLYCGEWIESHVLHTYMLHAPDFLGYPDAITLAKDHPDIVNQGLQLKKIGNDIVNVLGGREIHPINVRVGGFYRIPSKAEFGELLEKLKIAHDLAIGMVKLMATLPFPEFEQDYEFVALRHPDEYPFNEGRLISNKGLDIPISDYLHHFDEVHVQHSTALHSRLRERNNYFVGPLARYALNYDKLTPTVKDMAASIGIGATCFNPFKSIVIRALETLYACEEALRILEHPPLPDKPAMEYEVQAGVGHGCTEAPRGILYHRYEVDGAGNILHAKIIPPTSQNMKTIESDLWHFVEENLDLSDEELQHQCEQAVRNYDPCISCSVHFLPLEIVRE